MGKRSPYLATLACVLSAACSNFTAAPANGDAGAVAPDGGAVADAAADAPSASGTIVIRDIVSNESTDSVQAQRPIGTQKGDFLWATVSASPIDGIDHCTPSPGWTVKRKQGAVACSTVYSITLHLFRIATDPEPATESPCVLDPAVASGSNASVVIAAFGGVDPETPFEDFQAYSIPFSTPPTATLSAPTANASSASAETFAVFVDPDGHNDSAWAAPSGMTKRAALARVALFVAPAGQAGSVAARDTHKATNEDFCQTAEALSVVLHPKP